MLVAFIKFFVKNGMMTLYKYSDVKIYINNNKTIIKQ